MTHAIQRAKERYGLELTVADLRDMAAMIRAGDSIMLGYARDGTEKHLLTFRGVEMCVVYAPNVCHIVTVLREFGYRQWPDRYKQKLTKQRVWGGTRQRREKDRLRREMNGEE